MAPARYGITHRRGRVERDKQTDGIEVEEEAVIQVAARTPKAAYRMYRDLLTDSIMPVLAYGKHTYGK